MTDKFDKMTIYDVDFKMITEDGEELNYTFKPLPFKYYPKAFKLFTDLTNLQDTEDTVELLKSFDEPTITSLAELLKTMVSNSYPELDDKKVELFVMSNMFQLIEPLSKVVFKQTKAEPRKVQQIINNN